MIVIVYLRDTLPRPVANFCYLVLTLTCSMSLFQLCTFTDNLYLYNNTLLGSVPDGICALVDDNGLDLQVYPGNPNLTSCPVNPP